MVEIIGISSGKECENRIHGRRNEDFSRMFAWWKERMKTAGRNRVPHRRSEGCIRQYFLHGHHESAHGFVRRHIRGRGFSLPVEGLDAGSPCDARQGPASLRDLPARQLHMHVSGFKVRTRSIYFSPEEMSRDFWAFFSGTMI